MNCKVCYLKLGHKPDCLFVEKAEPLKPILTKKEQTEFNRMIKKINKHLVKEAEPLKQCGDPERHWTCNLSDHSQPPDNAEKEEKDE